MTQIDLFGNVIAPENPDKKKKKNPADTKKRKPVVEPSYKPQTPVKTPQVSEVKKEETGDLNAQYRPGETVKYRHPKKGWLTGVLLGFYEPGTPSCTKQKKIFSFIEIDVDGVIHKAYSLSQLRKIG